MKKIDATVLKETKYIAVWILILSLLMQSVFLCLGAWDYTVLLGNALSGAAAILNFFLMGITVQNALLKEEKEAKTAMRVSLLYRNLFLLVILILGITLPCFNMWAVVVPMFFTRIAVAIRPYFNKA